MAIEMNPSVEFEPGSSFVLDSNEVRFAVDRKAGAITLQIHQSIGRSKETEIPLGQIVALTLELVDAPPMSFATAGQIMGTVMAAMNSGKVDQQRLIDELPKGLGIRIEQAGGRAAGKAIEAFCTAPGLREAAGLAAMARQVADAAGFDYWAIYATPHAGVEVRLSNRPLPGLKRLPVWRRSESVQETAAIGSEALASAAVPPFEPERFRGGPNLTEWRPGLRVAFRRPFSRAAPFVFPFALCAIAGPALWIAGFVSGGDQDTAGLLIVTGIGLVIGVPAALILGTMLPRNVEFDWMARTLSIRTWFRSKTVPFERIECLVLKAERHKSSGGESGSTEITYRGKLRVLEVVEFGKPPTAHEITGTEFFNRPEQPLRMAVPLLVELAAALNTGSRIEEYEFRKGGP